MGRRGSANQGSFRPNDCIGYGSGILAEASESLGFENCALMSATQGSLRPADCTEYGSGILAEAGDRCWEIER